MRWLDGWTWTSAIRVCAVAAVVGLAATGCSDDDPATKDDQNQEADVGSEQSDAGNIGDTDPVEDTDAVEDAGAEDVGADPDTGSSQEDTGVDAGDGEETELVTPEAGLVITTDPLWVKHGAMEGSVAVDCEYRGDDGLPVADQPQDLEIDVVGYHDVDDDGRFSFAEAGAYDISCSSDSIDEETHSEIIVAYEGVAVAFVRAVGTIGELDARWRDFFAVIDEDDPDSDDIEERFLAIEEVAEKLKDFSDHRELLVEMGEEWPQLSDVEDEGFTAGADDEAWAEVVEELQTIQQDYRQALADLSLEMSDDELDALEDVLVQIQHLHQDLYQLEPSELAVYEQRDELAALIAEMVDTAVFQVEVFSGLLRENPVAMTNASFSGQLGTAAIKIAWKRLTGPLTGWYSDLLKDASRSIAVSLISMSFTEWWNSFMQPLPNTPVLTSVHGSAAGFICAGVPVTAYGQFYNSPEHMTLVILPPASLYPVTHLADAAESMWGVRDNVQDLVSSGKKIEKLALLANAVEGAWDDLQDTQMPDEDEFFTDMTAESGDGEFLNFEELPAPLNDGTFPAGGSVYLLDAHAGFGPAVDVTVPSDASCGGP